MKKQIIFILFMCGIPPLSPIPPLGCKELIPLCICDSSNNCSWEFECVKDD